jgi:hypothetical protein
MANVGSVLLAQRHQRQISKVTSSGAKQCFGRRQLHMVA